MLQVYIDAMLEAYIHRSCWRSNKMTLIGQSSNYDHLCKITLIGSSGVGKSSYIVRLGDNDLTFSSSLAPLTSVIIGAVITARWL